MAQSSKDIQLLELKDTISQLNNLISSLQKILETARANGLNPYKYMEYILEARPDGRMTDKELEALSPWNKNIKKLCEK